MRSFPARVPDRVVLAAAANARFFCLNAAPARGPLPRASTPISWWSTDEHERLGDRRGLVALTLGADGAVLSTAARRWPGPAAERPSRRRDGGRRRVLRGAGGRAAERAGPGGRAAPGVRGRGAGGLASRRPAVAADGSGGRRAARGLARCSLSGRRGLACRAPMPRRQHVRQPAFAAQSNAGLLCVVERDAAPRSVASRSVGWLRPVAPTVTRIRVGREAARAPLVEQQRQQDHEQPGQDAHCPGHLNAALHPGGREQGRAQYDLRSEARLHRPKQ